MSGSVYEPLSPELLTEPSANGDGRIADALAVCLETYRRWLYLPDDDVVLAVLGAIAANLTPGDPLWLLLVGAPGSGKTEVASPVAVMDYVHQAATLSAASLLSGTSKKEHEVGATGGLLRLVSDFGVLLVKDFSGVLSMNRDARAEVLAALREVYDGSWTRHVGTGGGRTLHWHGKCGVVGCVTPSIDRHSAVMGALGERFVLYRIEVDDVKAQARRRLANRGRERQMRSELADAVAAVLDLVDRDNPPRELTDREVARLVDLSTFVVGARSAVERDGYDREVVVMPSLEAPGRLVAALGQLLAGLEAIGASSDTSWRILTKAAWGCVPVMRTRLLEALHSAGDQRKSDLVESTGIPKSTAERAIEDLVLLHLVDGTKVGTHDTSAWTYRLSAQALADWPSPEMSAPSDGACPELSGDQGSLRPHPRYDDFSGEAPDTSLTNPKENQ